MDSITHIALGGLIGEAFIGKQLGKKSILIGALAQSIPDIDFISSLWLDTPHNLLAHRGLTHSFLFAVLLTPLLAWLANKQYKSYQISRKLWTTFFGAQILIHIIIDSLNAYGVGWLEPFSNQRFSFNVIFVADPFYSVWLGVSLLLLLFLAPQNKYRGTIIIAGLLFSSTYLVYALSNKFRIDSSTQKILKMQNLPTDHYLTTPTPFNNWLWYIAAKDNDGYHIGYRSVFDKKDSILFHFFPQNDSLLTPIMDHEDVKLLLLFSQGYYTAEQHLDTLIFNDLRFGQRVGWYNPKEKFVFQYYLKHPQENVLVVQRGRFAGWNNESLRSLYFRIEGY